MAVVVISGGANNFGNVHLGILKNRYRILSKCGHCILQKEKWTHQAILEKATPHIDLWTVVQVFNDHVDVFKTSDPRTVPVDLPRHMKASFVCEDDLFQVIFIILYATEHFQGKRLAFGSVVWFEFLQNLHLLGIKLQSHATSCV